MQSLFRLFLVVLTGLVISCGGGGGSPGATPGGSTKPVAGFDYVLDKNAISNSGADEVTLTATALDSNNNPVEGVAFKVNLTSGIYTPGATVTDQLGKVSGKVSTGADKSNRTITVTMTMGDKIKSEVIPVTGSKISLTTVPAAPVPGSPVTLSAKVVDVNGAGIPNIPVNLAGSLGFRNTLQTDINGNATSSIASAPLTAGIYTVEASGSGVTEKRDVQVISTTGGVPDAVGTISAASLAITPNTIPPNVVGSTTNRATLRALFQDSSNRAIKNVRVRFEILEPSLGAGEQISTGSAVVYTDQNGVASGDYIAGTRASPTNGVVIRACYATTDAGIAGNACPNFRTATMTVANEPLSITLGDNNKLETGNNELTYIKKFDVAVSDAAGNAVANAQISASVDLRFYRKAPGIVVTNSTVGYSAPPVLCPNEDTNRNGLLDSGEDVNGNGTIEPRKADIIISYLGGRVTGSNGRTTLQVEYPQNVAYWIEYAVKVTTSVAGSEGVVEKVYLTEALIGDAENGSFLKPPYGSQACNSPN
ncbi:MAG: Ig-like domain-containing protein [Acidovorax sp.]|uniref:Ig-like domain-containing protein n=1 Tax=Acidovorax sp. TaxID=1872122 RepID=UPI00391ADDAD